MDNELRKAVVLHHLRQYSGMPINEGLTLIEETSLSPLDHEHGSPMHRAISASFYVDEMDEGANWMASVAEFERDILEEAK